MIALSRRFQGALLRYVLAALLLIGVCSPASHAVTLAEYAQRNPLKLFAATKGSEMPNTLDQTNNLDEGDRALLLSGKALTDIAGISTLTVEDNAKQVPITSVKNLHLFLNQNQIAAIPDEIAALKNVVFLYANDNKIGALPQALTEMDSLVGIYFSSNRFTEIPPFVYGMTRLKKLQFSHNHITELPAQIGQLKELRHFNMADNAIAVLPESVVNLTKLRVCDFSDNRLTVLPEAFGGVRIVNQLRVRNNPLATLPVGFAAMRATIDITGTKIDPAGLPPELRRKISTEKPPGSKNEDPVVRAPRKSQ